MAATTFPRVREAIDAIRTFTTPYSSTSEREPSGGSAPVVHEPHHYHNNGWWGGVWRPQPSVVVLNPPQPQVLVVGDVRGARAREEEERDHRNRIIVGFVGAILTALTSYFIGRDYADWSKAKEAKRQWGNSRVYFDVSDGTSEKYLLDTLSYHYFTLLDNIKDYAFTGMVSKAALAASGMTMLVGALTTSQVAVTVGIVGGVASTAVILFRLGVHGWDPHHAQATTVLTSAAALETAINAPAAPPPPPYGHGDGPTAGADCSAHSAPGANPPPVNPNA